MKKSSVVISILVVLVLVLSFCVITFKSERDWLQEKIDESFAASYHELTLTMLNETVEGISDDAKHMYAAKNTKHSHNLQNLYQHSSYNKNGNADLDYIVAVLAQSAGYEAITEVKMDQELYRLLRDVPNDYFNNTEVLKAAKEALEKALIG